MSDADLIWQIETDPVLSLFLNSITDQAVFTIDPDGFITTWNAGCRRLKRYTYDEAIGEHFRMLYIPEDREQGHPEHNLREAFAHGEYHEERLRMRKDGEPFMANVSIYRLERDGQHAGFAKVVRDVSERHRLQEQQRAFEERLARSNHELEGFCHAITHDLRAPIRAIAAKCGIVREESEGLLPEGAAASLASIGADALRLGRIVDDLLAFAQEEGGAITRQAVDLTDMAQRVVADVAPHCQGGTARIEVQEGMRADVDPTMIEFVLHNLVENACKYSGPGVRIRVGMATVEGETVYHVRDDGLGFDPRDARRMFEPFARLHGDAPAPGTGIGLANVARVVARHGGRVWAESAGPGTGAAFLFTLGPP